MKQPIPYGNYYLMDLIAKGGMAEVFKAKYLGPEGFSKVVAVKRILPELAEEQDFIRMFIDEAKIASQLNHANITGILQLGEAQGSYFIAMEFVQGKDLRTIYERSRRDTGVPVSPPMAAFVISRVCEGIDYAHRRRGDTGKHLGIIHRDVSPQNVIVSFEGDVKLIDFGIAKAQDKLVKTEAGILKGKYCYMSPEQVRGLDIDHRSDIFGLGVVLHEILTRQRLFLGGNDLKTLENVLKQPILPPSAINPAVPAELDAITMRALSRDVDARFQYASEMHEELQRFLYSRPSVFSRRELSSYMNNIFGEDLDKELRRQASYEPFFEALPNTPMPSAMHLASPSSTALASVPPSIAPQAMTLQQPSLDSNPGSYISNISSSEPGFRNAEVTSYSGPHPHPAVQQVPAMVAPSAAPPAFPMSNPTSSMMPPPSARQSQAPGQPQPPPGRPQRPPPAPTVQGGVQFIPGGIYKSEPPAAEPPSFMFGGDDFDDDDDDEPTVLETSASRAKKQSPPTINMAEDDQPTRQLSYDQALAAVQQPQSPLTAPLMPAPQFAAHTAAIAQPQIPNEELLQPMQQAQPQHFPPPAELRQSAQFPVAQSQPPDYPMAQQAPQDQQAQQYQGQPMPATMAVPSFDELDEGTETLMQDVVGGQGAALAPQPSSGKGWIIVIIMLLMLLLGGLGGVYTYRCKLLGVCPPEPIYYTLVFAKPANDVDILLNGKQIPPHKYKLIAPNKIRLRFYKPGSYWLEVRKPGCQPLRNKARIVSGTEVETPHLPLDCR